MRSDQFFLERRMRGEKHDLSPGKVHIGVRVNRGHNLHRLPDRLPESLAVRFVPEMLCELIPGDDLPPVARDARQAVSKIGIKIESGRRALEFADRDLVQWDGMIDEMAVKRLRHAYLARKSTVLVERS